MLDKWIIYIIIISMNKAYISLGGNKPNSNVVFEEVLVLINSEIGQIIKKSSIYSSEAWGFDKQTDVFINQVIEVETSFSPFELLKTTQFIEKKSGRLKKTRIAYEDRVIDIDILFFNDEIINSRKLTVPHGLLHMRNFILTPLNEISPNFVHPVFQKSINKLLLQCKDNLGVSILKKG